MAMGFKSGGRKKGTPNKNNLIKTILRAHSTRYCEQNIKVDRFLAQNLMPPGAEIEITPEALAARLGVKVGDMVSQLDIDLAVLSAADRVDAEIKLLNFHTPKMVATAVDMTISDEASRTIEERLADLAASNESQQ